MLTNQIYSTKNYQILWAFSLDLLLANHRRKVEIQLNPILLTSNFLAAYC